MRTIFAGEVVRIPKKPTEEEVEAILDFISRREGVHHVEFTNTKYQMFRWREGACIRVSVSAGNYLTFVEDEDSYGIGVWTAKEFKEKYLM